MLSAVNKGAGPKGPMYKRLIQVGGELGFSGLWAGLGPRIGKMHYCSLKPSRLLIEVRYSAHVYTCSHDGRSGHRSVLDLRMDQGGFERSSRC
jgi:hypothetical protein